MGSFLSDWWKSEEWSWSLICNVRWWLILLQQLCSIYTTTVNKTCLWYCLVRFVKSTFCFKTLFKFFGQFFSLYIICNWIIIMGCRKHEHRSINMLYSLTRICHITSLPPHKQPTLHNCHFLLSPRQAIWCYAIVRFCTIIDLKSHPITQFEKNHIIRRKTNNQTISQS